MSRWLAYLEKDFQWKGDFCTGCNILYPIDDLKALEQDKECEDKGCDTEQKERTILACFPCSQKRPFRPSNGLTGPSREDQCLRKVETFLESKISRYLAILAAKFHWKGDFCAGCNILYPIDELDSTAHQGVLCCSLCAQQRPFRPCEQKVIGLLLSRQNQCLAEFPWDTWVCPTCRGVELVSSNGERMCVSRCYTKTLE